MTPTFSVIVPMRDAAATIAMTLRSALAQRGETFEILVLDDGSSDDSVAIVEAIARSDQRVRVIPLLPGGVARARNRGLSEAEGELVAFLDADDLWAPDKLASHAALHRARPDLAASYARIAFLPETATGMDEARTFSTIVRRPLQVSDAIGENPVCTTSNLVARRDVLLRAGGFAADWSHAEDQELVVRLVAKGDCIVGIDEVLTGYRFSRNGLSMDFGAMYGGWRHLADRFLPDAGRAAAEALYLRYLARRALRSGAGSFAPARLALAGVRRDRAAFLADRRRGWSTLAAALAAPAIPDSIRRQIFA